MSTTTCPNGHASTSADYCDTCGTPIEAAPAAPPATPPATPPAAPAPPAPPCPNCGAARSPDDAFCEVCGLDFATGQLPAPPAAPPGSAPSTPAAPAGPGDWVAVVEADRAFYEGNDSPDLAIAFPAQPVAVEVPLHGDEVLIGRLSESRGIFPDVDLGPPHDDPGVSRRHAVARRRGDGWVVADQGSTNGTWIGGKMLDEGEEVAVGDGDHVLVGAWTRVTFRRLPETPGGGATP